MVKVFLIILGEWRYFGHILYEKLSYILSILPDLIRELSYLVKKLIKSLYSLKISIRKKEVDVKLYVDVRFDFITNFIRYLDQKDKEAYKRYYEKEKERREKKLVVWENRAKIKDEELSDSLNGFREYLFRKEKKVNDWFYLRKVKFERKVNNRIKVFYKRLAKRIPFYRGEIEKINPLFLLWESKRKKKIQRWREWVKLKSPKFKPFLEKLIQIQEIQPHVQRFIVKWIFNPGVDYFVTKWINFLDWSEEKDWIRKSRKVERIIERFNFYETIFKEKGELYGSGVIKVWVPRFNFYWKKVPEYKGQYFYQRYLRGVEKHNDWWYNVIKKGVRKEVFNEEDLRGLCLRLNLGRLHSIYRFLFEIDEGRWKSIEGVEKRILENQKVSLFFRLVGRGYRFFLLIVMSDPFFYAWNVFFLVTGIYILLILAPFIIFFEWLRVKK